MIHKPQTVRLRLFYTKEEQMRLNEGFEKTVTSEDVERWRYPRFFCTDVGENVLITDGDAVHISRVLRMKRGDLAIVCDCAGNDMLCRIAETHENTVELEILDKRPSEGEPDVFLRLFQCMPKSDKMDFIVQKAVELGACEIIPVVSKRCVSRPDDKSAAKKTERWQKIAEEAAKQCGRGRIPVVGKMLSFTEAVGAFDRDDTCGIFFYECGGQTLTDIIAASSQRKIDIFIGPEGGFEREEAELAQKAGMIPATLGKRILRCETAPVAAISVLMNLTGNM